PADEEETSANYTWDNFKDIQGCDSVSFDLEIENERRYLFCLRTPEKMLLLDGCEDKPFVQPTKRGWTTDRIDRTSMIIFPGLFTLFNIIYWSYYLSLD
ncbi:unnamed protein product, partial [Cylicostephanus goldi]